MTHKKVSTVTVAGLALLLGLAACSSGGSPDPDPGNPTDDRNLSCTNSIVHPDAPQVLVWAYFPGMAEVVDSYNASHEDVQVCWNNTGAGGDTYTKFNTALAAGTGGPDVIHLEYSILPSYLVQDVLTDLTPYGMNDMKDEFSAGTWSDISTDAGVYATPVDGGPMGMLVRQDIFEEYGVEIPTTWDEFADAARQLRANGYENYITNFPLNGRQYLYTLMGNAGATPFTYDSSTPEEIGVGIDSPEVVRMFEYWNGLIDEGLVSTFDRSSPEDNARLLDGTYAAYIAAAWGPGFLTGLTEGGVPDGEWRAVRIPHWDLSDPHESTWGGSGLAVPSSAHNPDLAAAVALDLYNTPEQWELGISAGSLFPMWTPVSGSPEFAEREYPFFGGQSINADVFLPAIAGYTGLQLSPFQNAVYDLTNKALAAMVEGATPQEAADSLQQEVEAYAEAQGFTVK